MSICCCSLAGTAACQHCSNNPFATDVWTNRTVIVDHIEARPFGDGLNVCPVCGKPSTIGKPTTNADRFRSKTDEELTSFFIDLMKGSCPKPTSECFGECEACWLEWLKEEVKE